MKSATKLLTIVFLVATAFGMINCGGGGSRDNNDGMDSSTNTDTETETLPDAGSDSGVDGGDTDPVSECLDPEGWTYDCSQTGVNCGLICCGPCKSDVSGVCDGICCGQCNGNCENGTPSDCQGHCDAQCIGHCIDLMEDNCDGQCLGNCQAG